MRHAIATTAAAVLAGAAGLALGAQTTTEIHPGTAGSPHVRTTWTIDGANLAVEYGRPYLRGRPEARMMPPGMPWRTGADEATRLTTDRPLAFGTVTLEPGSYTINTVPGDTWQIVLGRLDSDRQWGIPYRSDLEIGRIPMTTEATDDPVEQVTISIDDTDAGATLRIEWGTTRALAPFTIG